MVERIPIADDRPNNCELGVIPDSLSRYLPALKNVYKCNNDTENY
jgi:hypothetical protein